MNLLRIEQPVENAEVTEAPTERVLSSQTVSHGEPPTANGPGVNPSSIQPPFTINPHRAGSVRSLHDSDVVPFIRRQADVFSSIRSISISGDNREIDPSVVA